MIGSKVIRSLCTLLLVAAALPASAADDDQKADGKKFKLDGYSSTSYLWRSTQSSGDNFTDSDIFERICLDVTFPDDNKYEFHLFGMIKVDADGDQDWQSFHPFEDVDDARKSEWAVYVYDAYVAFNETLPHLKQLRVGRQAGNRDEMVFFDGVAGDFELPRDVDLSVYGGRSVHFYEEDPGSDVLIGVGIDYSLTARTKLIADYLYADDERDVLADERNSLVSLKVKQLVGNASKVMVRCRMIDGKKRDLTFRSVSAIPGSGGLVLNVGYFSQLRSQNELSNEFSLFHDIMGVSEPYHNFDMNVRKPIGERHAINMGFAMRQLANDDSAERSFNREYERMFVTYDTYDLPREGMTVGATVERWQGDSGGADSFGLDVGYDLDSWREGANINVGTYYSLYKYDYYFDTGEKADVSTYYIKGKVPLRENITGNLSYEYEDAAGDNCHIVKMDLRYEF